MLTFDAADEGSIISKPGKMMMVRALVLATASNYEPNP